MSEHVFQESMQERWNSEVLEQLHAIRKLLGQLVEKESQVVDSFEGNTVSDTRGAPWGTPWTDPGADDSTPGLGANIIVSGG